MEEEHYYKSRNRTRTIFNFSVILAILLIAFSIFYYLVIFLPGKQKAQENKLENNKQLLSSCLVKVEENYKVNWNKNCKSEGLEDGCNLLNKKADVIDENRKQLRDECYKRYPQ